MQQFDKKVMKELEKVFVGIHFKCSYKMRQTMENYFLLCTSESLVEMWKTFLELAAPTQTKCALFYQHVTDIIFKSLIKKHYQGSLESTNVATIDNHERNALR